MAKWAALAATGADYPNKLASIPDTPEIQRAMALALIRNGKFQCEHVGAEGECGTVYFPGARDEVA